MTTSGHLRLGLGGAALAALMTLTACGDGDGGSSAAAPGRQAVDRSAFQECLRKQGVELPQRPAGQRPQGTPSGRPSGGPPSGGPGGGGGMGSLSPEQQKAFQACASLRPSPPNGQRGGGRPPNGEASAAFRDCMAKNGAEVAEGTRVSDLKTADPKVAKALRTCRPLLPQRGGGSPSSSPAA